ncbi:MAG: ABC transporter permease [Firmicutes bacterium]|nr:ABC transporter permease [Bacillota bacterium]
MKRVGCTTLRFSTPINSVREALIGLLRNGWMTLASVSIVAVSLIILGGSVLLVMNADYLAERLESKLEISVFLQEDLEYNQVKEVGNEISATTGVAELKYVSRETALQEMKQSFGSRGEILENLEENPFPDAYRIKAEKADQVVPLAKSFEQLEGVETVRYGKGVVEKLLSITHWLRLSSMTLLGILGVAAIFLIATSIRMSVFARRREIAIMKMLGATNWYIRMPFLLEGLIMGVLGSLLAIAVVNLSYAALVNKLGTSLSFITLVTGQQVLTNILVVLLGLGLFIGVFGSLISIHRFLKDEKA